MFSPIIAGLDGFPLHGNWKYFFLFIRNVRDKYCWSNYSSVHPNISFSRETEPKLGCGCLANHLQNLHPPYRSNISVLILKTTRWHRLLRKHSFQLSRIFLHSSYILVIYKERLLSVHLKEPSKWTYRT